MKKAFLILAAIASVLAVFTTVPAQAGGKRLQFGGPLGSFVATPYAKSSSHGRHSYKKSHRSHAARKAAARRAAAKKAHARKLAAKKAAARKEAARRAAAKKAHARKVAAKKAAAKKLAARKAAEAEKAAKLAESSNEAEKVAAAETDDDVAKLAPVKASAIAGANTLELEPQKADLADLPEPKIVLPLTDAALVEDQATAEEVAVRDANDEDVFEERAELECKKYIPSAGLTITVPCGS